MKISKTSLLKDYPRVGDTVFPNPLPVDPSSILGPNLAFAIGNENWSVRLAAMSALRDLLLSDLVAPAPKKRGRGALSKENDTLDIANWLRSPHKVLIEGADLEIRPSDCLIPVRSELNFLRDALRVETGDDPQQLAVREKVLEQIAQYRMVEHNPLVTVPSYPVTTAVPGVPAESVVAKSVRGNLATGLIVLMGPTEAGKTTYITKTRPVDVIIRVAEPRESVDNLDNVLHAVSFQEAISWAILLGSVGFLVTVDGARQLVYQSGGAAMGKGVSSAMFTLLTSINNLAALMGATIMITMNPLTGPNDDFDAYQLASRISSSVSSVVFLSKAASTNNRLAWWSFRMEDGADQERCSAGSVDADFFRNVVGQGVTTVQHTSDAAMDIPRAEIVELNGTNTDALGSGDAPGSLRREQLSAQLDPYMIDLSTDDDEPPRILNINLI